MNIPPDLKLIRTFVAVAEQRHFRRAADQLNATPSSISQQIRELERRVGAALLVRDRRNVSLTPAGEVIRAEGLALLKRADAMVNNALDAAHGHRAVVTIGLVGAATLEVLPKLVAAARTRAPALQLRFREMGAREQLDALRQGAIDLGLVRSEARASGLEFKTIHTEDVVCLLPSDHRLAEKTSVAVADLEGERIINLSREQDAAGHDFYVSIYRAAGFEPNIVQEVSQAATVLFVVSTMGCVGLGPAAWKVLHRDGVVIKPIDPPVAKITTRLVWKSGGTSAAVDVLLACADDLAAHRLG